MRDLGGDRDGERRETIATRVPGTMSEASEEGKHLSGVDPAAHRHTELAIAWKDPVRVRKRECCTHVDGLLAEELTPEPELALTLQVQGFLIGASNNNHLPVEVAEGVPVESE